MRCGQHLVKYASRYVDIAAEFPQAVLLKILEFPDESAIEFFSEMIHENLPLTASMAEYDHLPALCPFGFQQFIDTMWGGFDVWTEDTGIKERERIFYLVKELKQLELEGEIRT